MHSLARHISRFFCSSGSPTRLLVRVLEFTKWTVVDHSQRSGLCAVFHVAVSVHIVDGLPVTRITQKFHGIRNDGFVRVGISIGYRVTEPTNVWIPVVLDDLVQSCDLECVI